MTLLLSAAADGPCDPEGPGAWLCQRVLDATEFELAARLAGVVGATLRVVLLLLGTYALARALRGAVARIGRRLERRVSEHLDRAQSRGQITDTQRDRLRRRQRLQAVTGVLRGVVGAVVWFSGIVFTLTQLGISLQPILAGAGLAGILIGFGAQQLVRDVLAGIAILIEDQFGVGDWIEVDLKVGVVERVGLRSTAFRDVDGTVHHVLNGHLQHVANLSQEWARATFDVPLALDADIPAVKALIYKVANDLVEDPVWGDDIIGPPEIWGVQEFGPHGISVRVVIPTRPLRNFDVTRQLRERLKLAFEQAGVRMPSQLIEIGGQRFGYAVLTKDLPDVEPGRRARQRDEADTKRARDEIEHVTGEIAIDRDETTELRIERGPIPRPD